MGSVRLPTPAEAAERFAPGATVREQDDYLVRTQTPAIGQANGPLDASRLRRVQPGRKG